MATGQPGVGASVAILKGNPAGEEAEEVLWTCLVAARRVHVKVEAVRGKTHFMDQL